MKGTLSHEFDVALPASKLWAIYGTVRLLDLIVELLPDAASKIEIEKGDGGPGTVIRITYPPGLPGPSYQREKFVKVDSEQRVKVAVVIEGGMLDLGFLSYINTFEIIEKTDNSSTIKSSIDYEVDQEHEAVAASASTDSLAMIARTISEYLLERENDGYMNNIVMSSKLCFDCKLWIRRLFHCKSSGAKVISHAM